MWPFRKQAPAPSDLRERLETCERQLRNLQTDWLDFEAKVQKKLWRDAKARDRADPAESPPPPEFQAPQADDTDPRLVGRDPVSRRILLARRGRAPPMNGAV